MNQISHRARSLGPFANVSPRAVDIFLVFLVGATNTIAIAAAREANAREPDLFAYSFGLLMAVLLLARRRRPVAVLLGTAALLMVYYQLDYPGFFPAIVLAIPLYTAAAAGKMAVPLILGTFWVGLTLLYQFVATSRETAQIINDALLYGGFFAAIVLFGMVVRARRDYAHEAAERLRLAEADRERIAQELRVAQLVQEQFLPSELPELRGWRVAAFYRSAREVGGDFYNFIELATGTIGIAIGDVTDKGAPAALVMSATQGLLRAEAPEAESPSAVLGKLNDVLVLNTPEKMFVTCLYLVLDAATGRLRFANAGHNLPYITTGNGVSDLRATGMPLGLLPGHTYEEKTAEAPPGARLLLHSDGIAEAHNREGEMFGFPRIVKVMADTPPDGDLIDAVMAELDRFTGPEWEQEDDITMVTLERLRS
jgi:serine phosphatase RsbU (regulator of sigma subunit)